LAATVKKMISSARSSAAVEDKMAFYDSWAENYDQDVAALDYHAATVAAKTVSCHYSGERGAAAVLDVACGTGLLAKQMKQFGFRNFVGIDGSKVMLEQAQKKELYRDLKLCFLGEQRLPAETDSFDVVVICGSLSVDHVPVRVVKELWSVCKPGGYVCMTCRHGEDNLGYVAALERELMQMEEDGLWGCENVSVVDQWSKAVTGSEDGYISGSVYLYRKRQ
uniref:Methyltransferase-like protein 27 n=1 Tax=Salarias fasciatus TaxID=181472 RepID=A0A672GL71_SALFA